MRAVAIALALAACGGGENTPDAPVVPIDTDQPPREVHMSTQLIEAGGVLVEAEMIGGAPGDRAIIHLTLPSGTVDWNIHAHPNGETVTVHEELDVSETTYDFVPAEQTEWYLLLRSNNQAIEVGVRVELYGAMTFGFI